MQGKCIDSVHLSVVWKQLQPRLQGPAESCALSWAYLWVCSPYSGRTSTSNAAEAELSKSSRTQITLETVLFTLLPSGKRFRSLMAKTERLRRVSSPRPSGSWTQTQPLNIIWLLQITNHTLITLYLILSVSFAHLHTTLSVSWYHILSYFLYYFNCFLWLGCFIVNHVQPVCTFLSVQSCLS